MLRKLFAKLFWHRDHNTEQSRTQKAPGSDRDADLKRLSQLRQKSSEPQYKQYDDFLRGSVYPAGHRQCQSQNSGMSYWRQGHYTAHAGMNEPYIATQIKEQIVQQYVTGTEHYIEEKEEILTTDFESRRTTVPTIEKLPCITSESGEFLFIPSPDPLLSSETAANDDAETADADDVEASELDYIRYIFSPASSVDVLERMAESDITAPFILAQLAFSSHTDVRCAVALNARTPVEALWLLVQDDNPTVRYAIAENPHTAADVLHVLSRDENGYVSSRAQKTLLRIRGNKIIHASFGQQISPQKRSAAN